MCHTAQVACTFSRAVRARSHLHPHKTYLSTLETNMNFLWKFNGDQTKFVFDIEVCYLGNQMLQTHKQTDTAQIYIRLNKSMLIFSLMFCFNISLRFCVFRSVISHQFHHHVLIYFSHHSNRQSKTVLSKDNGHNQSNNSEESSTIVLVILWVFAWVG